MEKLKRILKPRPLVFTVAGGAVGITVYLLYTGLGST